MNGKAEWSDPEYYIHLLPEQHVCVRDIRVDASGPIELLEGRPVQLLPLIGLVD